MYVHTMVSMFVFPSFFCFAAPVGVVLRDLRLVLAQNHLRTTPQTTFRTFRVPLRLHSGFLSGRSESSKDADILKQVSTTGAKRALVCCANS